MKKSIYHDSKMSYLIIEPGTDIASSLSLNMMKNNKIQCLLDLECRYIDNNLALYYKIQGMQSLKEYIKEHNVNYNISKQLYIDIAQAVLNGEEFFLNEDSYVMDLEYIFWDKKSNNIKLCCVPGLKGDFQENIKKFTEEVIEYIDHNDKNAEIFIYGIYDLITDGGFIISDVQAYIKDFKPGIEGNTPQNKNNSKKYSKANSSNTESIKENTDYNYNTASNINQQKSLIESVTEPDRKNKYLLCIDKSFLPFRADRKGNVKIYLEDTGRITGKNQSEVVIGRSRDCNLILPAGYISRHHAVLYIEEGGLCIEDLNSSNGTFINGERIPANVKIPCNLEDVVSFAGIKCRLSCQ